jgi:hypothetical protein
MAREQVIWVDAGGGELNLNDWVNYICTRNQKGVWGPPFLLQSSKTPLSEGSQFRGVIVGERGVDLNQKIRGTTREELLTLLRDLSQRMDPLKGEGLLKFINGAETRILYCRPEGIKDVTDKETIAETILSFTANDPFLYDDEPVTTVFETSGVAGTFFSTSFFPMHLTRSIVYSTQEIDNPGNAETYPVWTIAGPGISIQLTNIRTGKVISLGNLELFSGQELIIDTRIRKKTVQLDGVNAFEYLADRSSLWQLLPGLNDIQIEMSGAAAESSVQLQFTPRYDSK